MMNGEIDYRDTFLCDKDCDGNCDNKSPFFVLRLTTLLLFLLLISIAMMNLFTGLAVGDTNEVLVNSEQERLWQQVSLKYFSI